MLLKLLGAVFGALPIRQNAARTVGVGVCVYVYVFSRFSVALLVSLCDYTALFCFCASDPRCPFFFVQATQSVIYLDVPTILNYNIRSCKCGAKPIQILHRLFE